MRSRKIDALVNLAIFALWLTVAVGLVFYACSLKNVSVSDIIVYSMAGLLFNYAVSVAFHELGHVIFAKACKLRLLYVNFGLFSVDFSNNKKIKFFTYFQPDAGELAFLPQKTLKKEHLKSVALGGLIFSLIYSVGSLIPLIFFDNLEIFCLLGVGTCSSFYVFTVNVLPFDKTSDGSIAFGKRDYCEVITEAGNHQKQILENLIPDEAPVFKTSNEPIALYYHYLYLLIQNRREEAFRCMLSLQNKLESLVNDEYSLIFPEVLFVCCEKGIRDEELKTRAEIFFSEEEVSPAILRAHVVYRKFYGDKEWAETLFSSYLKSLKNAPLFVKKVEEQTNIHTKFKQHLI